MDIWVFVHHRDDEIEEATYGLVTEAKRLLEGPGTAGQISAVCLGPASEPALEALGNYGVNRVLHATRDDMDRYQGERFARVFCDLIKQEDPACLLMAQSPETEDLAQRVAAVMGAALITRAMDFSMSVDGTARAIRPVANGYLFEDLVIDTAPPPIVLILPAVLMDTAPDSDSVASVTQVPLEDKAVDWKTRTVEVIEASPEDLDLEEADIIVVGGRGIGKGDSFDIIHSLARAIGGSVGGTRPIIDWGLLAYERQIGQTGKYVSPD